MATLRTNHKPQKCWAQRQTTQMGIPVKELKLLIVSIDQVSSKHNKKHNTDSATITVIQNLKFCILKRERAWLEQVWQVRGFSAAASGAGRASGSPGAPVVSSVWRCARKETLPTRWEENYFTLTSVSPLFSSLSLSGNTCVYLVFMFANIPSKAHMFKQLRARFVASWRRLINRQYWAGMKAVSKHAIPKRRHGHQTPDENRGSSDVHCQWN